MGGTTQVDVQHHVQAFSQRILEDDTRYHAIVREHLRNNSRPFSYDLPNYYHGLAGSGAHQFINYINFNNNYRTTESLIQIENDILNLTTITQAILIKENISDPSELTEVAAIWNNLFLEDWIKFRLQEEYYFDIFTKVLQYETEYYTYLGDRTSVEYEEAVSITIHRITEYLEQHFKDILIRITPYSDTEDLKTTTITYRTLFSDTRGVQLEEFITDRTVTESYIPKDTEGDEFSNDILFETTHFKPVHEEILEVLLPPSDTSYTITYRIPSGYKIWVYFPDRKNDSDLGQVYYPLLDHVPTITYNEPMLPMMLLRGSYFSANEWDVPIKQIDANDKTYTVRRPAFISEENFTTTKQILKSLGLDLQTLIDNIEENPDIKYISDAFLGFAVSPQDDHPATSKALWEFFYELKNYVDKTGPNIIKFVDHPFNVECRYVGLVYNTIEKVVGPVGTHTHKITGENPYPDAWIQGSGDKFVYQFTDKVERSIAGGTYQTYFDETILETYYYQIKTYIISDADGLNSRTETVEEKVIVNVEILERTRTEQICIDSIPTNPDTALEPCIREYSRQTVEQVIKDDYTGILLTLHKQISPTSCERIEIAGLQGITRIGWSQEGQELSILDATSEDLFIPLPEFIITKFSVLEKIDLLERTLRLVIYSEQIEVTEYYEMNPLFQAFIQIIGIVVAILLAVFTYGAGSALSVAIVSAMETVIIGIGIALVVKVLLTVVEDPTLRMIIGIIGAVAGLAAGGFSFDVSNILNLAVVTADTLVKATVDTSLASVQKELGQLQSEQEAFQEDYNQQSAELEAAWNNINQGLGIEDMVNISLEADSFLETDTGFVVPLMPSTWYNTAIQTPYRYDLLFNGGYDKVNSFFNDSLVYNY